MAQHPIKDRTTIPPVGKSPSFSELLAFVKEVSEWDNDYSSTNLKLKAKKLLTMESELSEKDRNFIDKMIKELSEAGYTYNDMIAIFREASRMYSYYKQKREKQKTKGKI